MSWLYIIASTLWAAAAVCLVAWYLVRSARAPRNILNSRRKFPRPVQNFRASLKLQKLDGTSATIQVRGSNLTLLGAGVISDYPVPPGSVVFIDLPCYHLMGFAHVQHCEAHWLKYSIGMEFRRPLLDSYDGDWEISVVDQSSSERILEPA